MPQKLHRNPLFLFLQIALLALLGCTTTLSAQQYTVQIGTQLIPPYSLTLSDYYASTSERLVVLLTNTDLSKPQLNVQLRMTIEGQGVKIRTRQGAFTPIWQLQAGVPLRISTADLTAYFEPNNIDAQEWPAALRAQGKLPEGFYKFCFEAVETGSNQLVGRSSCAMAWLSLSDPPLLNLPNKGESVSPKGGITNIIFQWTPRHMNSPNAAYSTNYEFSLYELWDNGMEPEAAIAYAPLMYQNTTSTSTLLYGPAEPPLVEGKRYAWRVKAQAKQGIEQRDVFRNNGNSEVGWFTYQSSCTAPLNVQVDARSQAAIFTWTAVNLADQRYQLQYREAGKDRWYSVEVLSVTPEVRQGINNLKAATAYEYRVGTYCPFVLNQAESFTYTPLQHFETTASPAPDPNCGVLTPDIKISNRIPLATLNNGDVIMAGDFPVKLLSVQGNTLLRGAGYVMIPVMGNSKVKVSFTNIQVNSDRQLIAGFIETTYNDSLNYDVTKELIQGGTDVGKVKDGRTHTDYEVDFSMDDSSVFRYDTTRNELIIRNGNDSIAVPLHHTASGQSASPDGSSASTFPATIKDKDGKIYQLEQKDPNHPEEVTATYIGTAAEPIPDGAVNYKQLDSDKAVVRFDKGDGYYAFDQWLSQYEHILLIRDTYEQLEGGYYVPWKLLPPGKTDKVSAVIDIKDSQLDPEKVIFKTPKGTVFEREYKAATKTYTITLTGGDAGDAQEVYALYPAQGGGYLNLGKLSVASYTEQRYKLVVVQVNDKLADTDAMAAELNRVYNPIGITWEVTSDAFNYADTSKFFAKQSGLLSAYNSQMKTFQAAYAAQRQVDPAVSYLFLLRYSGAEDVKNRNAAGFMPRGKQFGYLFTTGFGSSEVLYTAAAHELGHGRFQLIHTFSSTYGERLAQGTTDNLMDYTDRGQHLAKWQWDLINDPGIVVRVFERDEDAMSIGENYAKAVARIMKSIQCAQQYGNRNVKIFLPTNDFNVKIKDLTSEFYWHASDCGDNEIRFYTSGNEYANFHNDYIEGVFDLSTINYNDKNKSVSIKGSDGQTILISAYDPSGRKLDCIYSFIKSMFSTLIRTQLYSEQIPASLDILQYASPCEFISIPLQQRKKLLQEISDSWHISDSKEKIAIQLVSFVSQENQADLLEYLRQNPVVIKNLYNGIDDYREEFVCSLYKLYIQHNTNETVVAIIPHTGQKEIDTYGSLFTGKLSSKKYDISISFTSENKIKFESSTYWGLFNIPYVTISKEVSKPFEAAPFETIEILINDAGSSMQVPAIMAKYLGETNSPTAWTYVKELGGMGLRTTVLLQGVQNIFGASTILKNEVTARNVFRLVIGYADLASIGLGDICNSSNSEFCQTFKKYELLINAGLLSANILNDLPDIYKGLKKGLDDPNLSSVQKKKLSEVLDEANIAKTFKIGDEIAGIKILKVKLGTNGKVAIIGRRMSGHVETVAGELTLQGKQVEIFSESYQRTKTFNISGKKYTWAEISDDFKNTKGKYTTDSKGYILDSELPKTLMYQANNQWAEKLIKEGYDVIDIGYPLGVTSKSLFYDMELQVIF